MTNRTAKYIRRIISEELQHVREEVSMDARTAVIELLKTYNGREVPDSKMHDIAKQYRISPHELESFVYSLASAHVVGDTTPASVKDEPVQPQQ